MCVPVASSLQLGMNTAKYCAALAFSESLSGFVGESMLNAFEATSKEGVFAFFNKERGETGKDLENKSGILFTNKKVILSKKKKGIHINIHNMDGLTDSSVKEAEGLCLYELLELAHSVRT